MGLGVFCKYCTFLPGGEDVNEEKNEDENEENDGELSLGIDEENSVSEDEAFDDSVCPEST